MITCLYLMVKSQNIKVWWEYLLVNIGFSIYAGWITSATIISIATTLKIHGMESNEEAWGVAILWIAFAIYNAAAILKLNTIFGSVFIWSIYNI